MPRLSFASFTFTVLLAMLSVVLAMPVPVAEENKRSLSGQATYFYVGLGACGWNNVDNDWVVALATSTYANGGHCGKQIHVSNSEGTSATAIVVDECPGCGPGDLDMSPDLFSHFASLDLGVFDITWDFVDGSGQYNYSDTSDSETCY